MTSNGALRSASASRRRYAPFLIWLCVFYVCWLGLVVGLNAWDTLRSHWPISVTMMLGSYVAGSTPMGGGTVGFPVLVLLFDLPGSLGRNFGLAIQSIGMVSASVFILSTGRRVAWAVLWPAILGSCVGTPLGAAFVAPFVPDVWVKLTFGVVWASFGVMHLLKIRELVRLQSPESHSQPLHRHVGLAVGFVGGILASITGVGIDMVLYVMLVLLFREDLKTAIPTSVIIMAFTSLLGIGCNVLLGQLNPRLYAVDPEVFANWLAAAPVVALGAPLGALIVNLISRTPTLIFVSVLCIGQFVWTLLHEGISGWTLVLSLIGLLAMTCVFQWLYQKGVQLESSLRPLESLDLQADSGSAASPGRAAWASAGGADL